MEVIVATAERVEEMRLVEHPIVDFYVKEVQGASMKCPCDDYEVCDYDAS